MFKKYKSSCYICNQKKLKLFMNKKDKVYICSKCANIFLNINNNTIFNYSLEEIKKSVNQNISLEQLHREEHIKKRKQDYLECLNSIKILTPLVSNIIVKRSYLKDMPLYNFSSIRKNTPQNKLENFVVIDTETTGLKPSSDEIIEISAIKFINGEATDCLTTLIKPKKEISNEITSINHITNEMVKHSPSIGEVINEFSKFIHGFNIVGYNLDFDLQFLYVNGMDFFSEKRQFYDALDLARKVYKNYLGDCKLDTVAKAMELYRTQCHRATEDAFVTGIIFRDLGEYIKSN